MAFITLSQLTKAVKGLVNKVNLESNVANSKIGQLSNLSTTNKDNLVAAVNEVQSEIDTLTARLDALSSSSTSQNQQ